MKEFVRKNKKCILMSLIASFLVAATNTIISFWLRINYLDKINTCNGSNKLIHFCPTINKSGSMLNLKFGLHYNQILFIGMILIWMVMVLLLFFYFLYLHDVYHMAHHMVSSSIFLMGALVSRVIERFLWGETFDYIAIKEIGILDGVDIFLFLGLIALMVEVIICSRSEAKQTAGMDKEQKKKYLSQQGRKFWALLINR